MHNLLCEFWENFRHNLFKPLLLFFYMGFTVPLLGVKLDFPHVIYQGLTIYLLLAIGWHGGEELALLPKDQLANAAGFMLVGFLTNFVIGCLAYLLLRVGTRLRRVDAATVGGYYGSDSAGTFVTCVGVLTSARIVYAPYMPVMLAVMEIPGAWWPCSSWRCCDARGWTRKATCPMKRGTTPAAKPSLVPTDIAEGAHGHPTPYAQGVKEEAEMALEKPNGGSHHHGMGKDEPILSPELLHEVFLNPGLFLLFAGIAIGFLSGFQGYTSDPDKLFLALFPGLLCLFLLEMGMTASRKLMDLRTAGWRFVVFGLVAPNVFATIGILVAHAYSMATHQPFDIGTYVLFSVLCGAASYIAVPAVQRLAIPEASPTLPLAASLGLTFSYNVTVGIPIYIQIAKLVKDAWPIA